MLYFFIYFFTAAAHLTVWQDNNTSSSVSFLVPSSRSKDTDTKCLREFKQMEGLYWEGVSRHKKEGENEAKNVLTRHLFSFSVLKYLLFHL